MESFELYYEKFSLNPRNWFISPEEKARLKHQDDILRARARKYAHVYIPKLKQVLQQAGYSVHKHGYAYTSRRDRKLGLSMKDSKEKFDDPVLSIPYIKILFTLAHEVGHVLQWDDETGTRYKWEEFLKHEQEAEKESPYKRLELEQLHKLWYELDAWVTGMQFIPVEFKPKYKQYAYAAYKTYMVKYPRDYQSEMLLRNLLYLLNTSEQ